MFLYFIRPMLPCGLLLHADMIFMVIKQCTCKYAVEFNA